MPILITAAGVVESGADPECGVPCTLYVELHLGERMEVTVTVTIESPDRCAFEVDGLRSATVQQSLTLDAGTARALIPATFDCSGAKSQEDVWLTILASGGGETAADRIDVEVLC